MRRRLRALSHYLQWLPICVYFRFLQSLPEAWIYAVGRLLGRIGYRICPRERWWCRTHLQLVYGDSLNETDREKLTVAIFENLALTLVDILRMDARMLAERVEIIGREAMEKARASANGKGFIGIGGHFGNWEIIGGYGKVLGLGSATITRPMDNPYMERELLRCRKRYATNTVPRKVASMREAIRGLRGGDVLGIAIDSNTIRQSVFVDFMGTMASAACGAAKIAIQEDVPVILFLPIRIADGRYQLILEPVPVVRTGDLERDIEVNTQRFTDHFTAWVHRYPEQWMWPHPRWRTRPDGSNWSTSTPIEEIFAARRSTCPPPSLPWQRQSKVIESKRAA